MKRVGVLALQGDWRAHGEALARTGRRWQPVRGPADLAAVTGLVLPGGESTAMLRLLPRSGLVEPLRARISAGLPMLVTCAGLILAAREVRGSSQRALGWLDVVVERNAWGRQAHSFVDRGRAFIRAPRIVEVGPSCRVLDTVRGEPALVRQGAIIGATFHPELGTDDTVLDLAFGGLQ